MAAWHVQSSTQDVKGGRVVPFLFARGKGRIYPWLLAPVPVVGPCRRTYLNGLRQDRELGCRVFFTLSHVQAVASICDFCFACDLAGLVFVQAFLQNSRVEGIHAEMPRQWMYSVNLCVSMCTYLNIFFNSRTLYMYVYVYFPFVIQSCLQTSAWALIYSPCVWNM